MSCWTTIVCGAAAGTVTIVTGRRRCGRSGLGGVSAASGSATLLEAVKGWVAATNGWVAPTNGCAPGMVGRDVVAPFDAATGADGFENLSPAHAGPASSSTASI